MISYNIPFGFFLLSFNDYIGNVIDSFFTFYSSIKSLGV